MGNIIGEQLPFCDEIWPTKHAVVLSLAAWDDLLAMLYCGGINFLSSNSHPGLRDAFDMAACNHIELGKGEIVGK